MPNKTGAGGKPQEYDKSTGRYGGGSVGTSQGDVQLSDKERKLENLARKWEGRAPLAGSSKISEVRKPEKFRDTMTTAKESVAPEDRWRVDVHSAEEYDKDKMYSSEGGSCVAVEPSGNIISVCKREGDVIFGSDLLRHAVENGGDRLDAFGKKLYKFYTKNGFEPVSWVPFNEEYAPEGWSKTRDKAEPVIFYKYTGQQITLLYEEFLNDVKPHESYDEAMVFRDKEMQK